MDIVSSHNQAQKAARRLVEDFGPAIVFIRQIAVAAYLKKDVKDGWVAEYTRDVDFMMAEEAFWRLRDKEEVTANRKLTKYQAIKGDLEFDIYVENQHKLRISFEEALAFREVLDGLPVASPEHLLILKSAAAFDRQGRAKGDKDLRDIVKLVLTVGPMREELLAGRIDQKSGTVLSNIPSRIFNEIVGQNIHKASELQAQYDQVWQALWASINPPPAILPCRR